MITTRSTPWAISSSVPSGRRAMRLITALRANAEEILWAGRLNGRVALRDNNQLLVLAGEHGLNGGHRRRTADRQRHPHGREEHVIFERQQRQSSVSLGSDMVSFLFGCTRRSSIPSRHSTVILACSRSHGSSIVRSKRL